MIKMRGGIPALLLRLICEGSNQNPLKRAKALVFYARFIRACKVLPKLLEESGNKLGTNFMKIAL